MLTATSMSMTWLDRLRMFDTDTSGSLNMTSSPSNLADEIADHENEHRLGTSTTGHSMTASHRKQIRMVFDELEDVRTILVPEPDQVAIRAASARKAAAGFSPDGRQRLGALILESRTTRRSP